ncbi:MAG: FKBP-type peptidyl-prolyl cis-trans isomerase, partial [Planctomycetes bacterium]|nr:FKBP-type peptidyl-prolyl cis-trans isomerase [Planctomycetota bacterium]
MSPVKSPTPMEQNRGLKPAASSSARPKADDAVKLHYTMRDKAGKLLDTTRGLGPATLEIARLFPGWWEGLLLMQVGARFELEIPTALGPEAPRAKQTGLITMDIEFLEILPAPRFEKPDAAKLQKSAGGFSFQILREGKGQKIREEENFKMHFAFWNEKGKLIDWTRKRGPMPGTFGKMKIPFLNSVLTMMQVGSVLLCEVPPEICFGGQHFPGLPPQSKTIWKVELLKIIPP